MSNLKNLLLPWFVALMITGPQHSSAADVGWPRLMHASGVNKTPVHLIGVQPYSGGAGTLGFKIEPMIQLALEHIENHPTLLPNHKVVMHFVDSGCSNKKATDVIFEQHVVGPTKFGVFGAACTGACMAASDVSRNFKTTNFAQLCTGTAMSDSTTYPEFARFAPDLDKNSQTAVDLTSLFGWTRVAVVMENKGLFTSMGEMLANKIRDDPNKELISFEKIFPMATDLEANQDIAGVVDRLIEEEARIILFVGYERTIARMLCEASKRGFVGRKVVFIYATFWINSDWYQEFASVTRCSPDEILQASQGLLGVDRLRLAQDSAGLHSGSNWAPSAIMQEYHARCDPALNTSDPSRYGCSDMHAAYSYDAMWGWAFTLDRWLSAGHTVGEVDYVSGDARRTFFETEVNEQDFQGLTGRVRHYPGGDRDGELQIFQFQGTTINTLSSVVDQGQTFSWSGVPILWGGLQSHSFDPTLLGTGTLNGSQWPADKPEVCAQPLHLVADAQDVLGTERCEPCSGGHRYLWDATLLRGRCLPCDVGTARAEGANSPSCTTCEVGTFANETGMTQCRICPEGHTCRAGTAVPQPCGLGLYAPMGLNDTECMQCDPGSYADEMAMPQCHVCDEIINGSTSPTAARSSSECRCAEGFVLLAGHGCAMCNSETMTCPGGVSEQHVVTAKEGFYLQGPDPVQMDDVELYPKAPVSYKCTTVKDCPGGLAPNECPEGHVGLVCASCSDGFTRRGGACHPCVQQQDRMVLITSAFVIVYIIMVILILRMSTDAYKVYLTLPTAIGTTMGFFVTFVQLHQILGVMSVAWPKIFKDSVLTFADIFTFNMEEGSMDCNVLKSGLGLFLPKVVLFPVTLVFMTLVWGIGRLLFPAGFILLTTRGNTLTLDSLYNAMGLVTNIAFVPLAVHTTGIFNCYRHPTGQVSMRSIPFMICYEDEWATTLLPAGIISLLLLVVAPFALFVFLVYKATAMPNAASRLPFLMARFRPDAYWWGLVILGRNLALALAMIVAPTKPFVVSFLLMCITMAYLHAVLRNNPWKFHGHTVIDALMSVAFALVLTVGVAFADTMTYPNTTQAEKNDPSWTVLATCGTLPFFASLLAMLACAYFGGRESRPEEHSRKAEELYLLIKQTIATARSAFVKKDKPEANDIRNMLARITELSAHDWEALKSACRILDALSLDQNLKGRISICRDSGTRSSSNGVDVDGLVQRLSSTLSQTEADRNSVQVVVV